MATDRSRFPSWCDITVKHLSHRAYLPVRPPKRRLGDRDHPSIEERVQRERPCRTLFIRNVTVRCLCASATTMRTDMSADLQFEADADRLRAAFAGYGDIKTYFDLVKNRGMIFITYVRFSSRN